MNRDDVEKNLRELLKSNDPSFTAPVRKINETGLILDQSL